MSDDTTLSANRRQILRVAALAAIGSAGTANVASAEHSDDSDSDDGSDGESYSLTQDGQCVALDPIEDDQSAAEFYNWDEAETQYSAAGARDLQMSDASVLFLYRADDGGVYLILIHGELEGESDDGGSVSMTFEGMPDDGSWIVQDDFYDGPSLYDVWEIDEDPQSVDWTWNSNRTDGGVFGPLGDDVDITVDPGFNEEAALFGEHYEGTVDEWVLLSGDRDDPEETSLDMDEPIRIRSGGCDGADDDDDDDDEKTYSRDEIAQAKYDLDFEDLSDETAGQVQAIYNRQPFPEGTEPSEILTPEQIAEEKYGVDVEEDDLDDELSREQLIKVQNAYDEQFGDLPDDPEYSRDEIARAKYELDFEDLSVETTGEVQAIYNRQPFADDRDPDDVLTLDEIAQERYDSEYEDLGAAQRIAVVNAYDAQFE